MNLIPTHPSDNCEADLIQTMSTPSRFHPRRLVYYRADANKIFGHLKISTTFWAIVSILIFQRLLTWTDAAAQTAPLLWREKVNTAYISL